MAKTTIPIILLLCFTACSYAQKHVPQKTINSVLPHPIRSIITKDGSITIDPKIVAENKNLQEFINDLQTSKLTLSYKSDNIPAFISSFLKQLSNGDFTIANPGNDWNCCDDDHDEKLPNRKLICMGKDGCLFLISYLTGGIGESQHLVLITYKNETITDFWTGTLWGDLKSKKTILESLNKSKNEHYGFGFKNNMFDL